MDKRDFNKLECDIAGNQAKITVLDYHYATSLSTPYQCTINFVTESGINPQSLISKDATLIITQQNIKSPQYIHGQITELIHMGKIGHMFSYQMLLAPHFLEMQHHKRTEVFLNNNIPDIIKAVFKNAQFKNYRLELSHSYQKIPFICQFQETDFNFISRWLEHEGIYYYFEHSSDKTMLILTDHNTSHKAHQAFKTLPFNPEGIVDRSKYPGVIEVFSSKAVKVPKTLELKAYNYTDDTKSITASAEISKHGVGTVEAYDENVLDESDAKRIAKVKAEAYAHQSEIYTGKAQILGMIPGCYFDLSQHFIPSYNQSYLVCKLTQKGSQREVILAYLGLIDNKDKKNSDHMISMVEFKAIPKNIQFRAPALTPIKRIDGIIPAILDAETKGEYAQLDNQGRYKVRLLHSDKPDGHGSDWVRKMEAYLGNQYGLHFPLHKNTEICLAFQFGNPDRPIIMGALHNSSNKNLVTSKNQKTSLTKSAGGNMMEMGDQKSHEYTHLYSPVGKTEMVIGHVKSAKLKSGESPKSGTKLYSATEGHSHFWQKGDEKNQVKGDREHITNGDYNISTHGSQSYTVMGSRRSKVLKNDTNTVLGSSSWTTMGAATKLIAGMSSETTLGIHSAYFMGPSNTKITSTVMDLEYCTAVKVVKVAVADVIHAITGKFMLLAAQGIALQSAMSVDISALISTNISSIGSTNIKSTISTNVKSMVSTNLESKFKTNIKGGDVNIEGTKSVNVSAKANIACKANSGIVIDCMGKISFKCGSNTIELTPAGIKIDSKTGITLACGGAQIKMTPASIKVSAPIVQAG